MTQTACAPPRSLKLGLLLMALVGTGCADPRPATIAVTMGEPAVAAARLAFEEADLEELGVDTILIPDPSNLASRALVTAQELLEIPSLVAVVGHANSAASLAASSLYNEREVLQLAPHSTTPLYSEAGPYSFRMVPPDSEQGPYLARGLLGELGSGARLAVLYVNNDYGRGLRDAFLGSPAVDSLEIVLQLPHIGNALDPLSAEKTVAALEREEPAAIVWLSRGYTLQSILPTIRKRLGPVPIWGGDATALLRSDQGRNQLWAGVRWVDFFELRQGPRAEDFHHRYTRRTGRPPTTSDVLTYDAVTLLLEAVRSGARSGAELRRHMEALGRDRPPHGGLSGHVAFSERGDLTRGYVLRTVAPDGAIR